jgi:hypothetical protein
MLDSRDREGAHSNARLASRDQSASVADTGFKVCRGRQRAWERILEATPRAKSRSLRADKDGAAPAAQRRRGGVFAGSPYAVHLTATALRFADLRRDMLKPSTTVLHSAQPNLC